MQIRGLTLPAQFVGCIEGGVLRRNRGSWQLRDERDAYGQPLETELGQVYQTLEEIQRESAKLPQDFPPEFADFPEEFSTAPGFIPYIVDFNRVLTFGIAGDGAPFCFDFRESAEPSIIWWEDAYWRLIAPSFDTLSVFSASIDMPNTSVQRTRSAVTLAAANPQTRRQPARLLRASLTSEALGVATRI